MPVRVQMSITDAKWFWFEILPLRLRSPFIKLILFHKRTWNKRLFSNSFYSTTTLKGTGGSVQIESDAAIFTKT